MTPEQAISSLAEVRGQLHTRLQHFRGECEAIEEHWANLARAGGQRADHAAALLARLKPHLNGITQLCECVVKQIDEMPKDPFGCSQ
jgi:hypothetical protein